MRTTTRSVETHSSRPCWTCARRRPRARFHRGNHNHNEVTSKPPLKDCCATVVGVPSKRPPPARCCKRNGTCTCPPKKPPERRKGTYPWSGLRTGIFPDICCCILFFSHHHPSPCVKCLDYRERNQFLSRQWLGHGNHANHPRQSIAE